MTKAYLIGQHRGRAPHKFDIYAFSGIKGTFIIWKQNRPQYSNSEKKSKYRCNGRYPCNILKHSNFIKGKRKLAQW